ncbi:DUF5054 domain-containing protein, partial [Clostridium perfringens]
TRSYSHYESSWQEQRDYLEEAVQSLPKGLAAEARIELDRMSRHQTVPDSEPMQCKQPIDMNELYELGQFQVSFADDGSINRLMDRCGKAWADEYQRLGTYRYETFSKENYDRFFKEYVTNLDIHHGWADNDFGKPGIEYVKPRPEHRRYTASLRTMHLERCADYDIVTVEMKLPEILSKQYGAPRRLNVIYTFLANEPVIE